MATPIDPGNTQDWDEPLNTDADFTSKHVFSVDDITVTFGGETIGTIADRDSVYDTSIDKVTKEGVTLHPIDSEFGFYVDDFNEAIQKELDGDYAEGWAGDLVIGGEQVGVVRVRFTDRYLQDSGGSGHLAGRASAETPSRPRPSTTRSCRMSFPTRNYPGDPDADYALDDNLILLSQNAAWDGSTSPTFLPIPRPRRNDKNGDGVLDIRDLLNPNESTIEYDIAYSTDYSVTMKDDGKLLYRWGNTIKRPNDIRMEAELPLPDEWTRAGNPDALTKLFQITRPNWSCITRSRTTPTTRSDPRTSRTNPRSARLPTYEIIPDYNETETELAKSG